MPYSTSLISYNGDLLDTLSDMVDQHHDLTLGHRFHRAVTARKGLNQNPCELLFVDVDLPVIDCSEILEGLFDKPNVIFTSAYPETRSDYNCFEPIGFLQTPIDKNSFDTAIERAIPIIDSCRISLQSHCLTIGKRVGKSIPIKDIIRIEAMGDYVQIFTPDTRFIFYATMQAIEMQLKPYHFARVHRSHIVNIRKIDRFNSQHVFISGTPIPVSITRRNRFYQILENH